MEWVAATAAGRVAAAVASTPNVGEALNEHGAEAVAVAKCHAYAYMARSFAKQVAAAQAALDASTAAVLSLLCRLFCITRILDTLAEVAGLVTQQQAARLRAEVGTLAAALRRDAVPLVDSFDFSDAMLNSTLGRYDGRVYEHHLRAIMSAPQAQGVPQEWVQVLRPMLRAKL